MTSQRQRQQKQHAARARDSSSRLAAATGSNGAPRVYMRSRARAHGCMARCGRVWWQPRACAGTINSLRLLVCPRVWLRLSGRLQSAQDPCAHTCALPPVSRPHRRLGSGPLPQDQGDDWSAAYVIATVRARNKQTCKEQVVTLRKNPKTMQSYKVYSSLFCYLSFLFNSSSGGSLPVTYQASTTTESGPITSLLFLQLKVESSDIICIIRPISLLTLHPTNIA